MRGEENIHPTAVIDDGVELGNGCQVGPYAYLQRGAILGENCLVHSHAVIKTHARLGNAVEVGHFAVIGGNPQHLSFDTTINSSVFIGSNTRLGEGVTIHRSIEKDGVTSIGRDCFLMGYTHVAHDCKLGDRVIMANGSLLGGHAEIGDDVFIGGGAAIHQFVRIGLGAMIGGLAEISLEVAPQLLVSGRNEVAGLNLVGLRRRNSKSEDIKELKQAYHLIMRDGNLIDHAQKILAEHGNEFSELTLGFARFFIKSKRGYARPHKRKSK